MSRLLSPDDKCVGVTVPFGRGQKYNGKTIEVSDPSHVRALRQAGYTMADMGGAPIKSGGYECSACSFQSYFKLCSRCGAECDRPDLVA